MLVYGSAWCAWDVSSLNRYVGVCASLGRVYRYIICRCTSWYTSLKMEGGGGGGGCLPR